MKCPKCGHPDTLVEALEKGDKRVKCSKCGLNEVRDKEGRKLLVSESGGSGRLLLS
jgi:uncharacterized metal-binding protein (TIGR02443 family)